jgi:hypothetical protein
MTKILCALAVLKPRPASLIEAHKGLTLLFEVADEFPYGCLIA